MKLYIKFGIKALLRNWLRAIVCLVLCAATVGAAGVCIFYNSYDVTLAERELYFGTYGGDKYLNLFYDGDWCPSVNLRDRSREAILAIEEEVNKIGGGYALQIFGTTQSTGYYCGIYLLNRYFGEQEGVDYSLYGTYQGEQLIAPYAYLPDDYYDFLAEIYGTGQVNPYMDNYSFASMYFHSLVCYSGEDAINDFGYTLYGELPEKIDEVAIPQAIYNSFLCYGYRDPQTDTVSEIKCEDDIIGKSISLLRGTVSGTYGTGKRSGQAFEAKITGVIHMDLDEEDFGFYNAFITHIETVMPPFMDLAVSRAFLDYAYDYALSTDKNFQQNAQYAQYVTVLRNGENAEKYFKMLTDWKRTTGLLGLTGGDRHVNYWAPTRVADLLQNATGFYLYAGEYRKILEVVTTVMPLCCVLAVLFSAYFCTAVIYKKRRSIGIMRSMGCTGSKLFVAFLIPLLLFSLLYALGAFGAECVFMNWMNSIVAERAAMHKLAPFLFSLNWQTYLFTFGVPILVAAVTVGALTLVFSKAPVIHNIGNANKKQFKLFKRKTNIGGTV